MIQKDSNAYKSAQELANKIQRIAGYQRFNNNSSFELYFNDFYNFISDVKKVEGFASKVAETIDNQANPYGYQIARVSSKQAWIIACAAVENNITLN